MKLKIKKHLKNLKTKYYLCTHILINLINNVVKLDNNLKKMSRLYFNSNNRKALCAMLLLLFFSGHFVFELGYLLYFKANQTKIAAQFCENKDKPQMGCNGKCHLSEQLDKHENAKSPNATLPSPETMLQTFVLFEPIHHISALYQNFFVIFPPLKWGLIQGITTDISHPPEC